MFLWKEKEVRNSEHTGPEGTWERDRDVGQEEAPVYFPDWLQARQVGLVHMGCSIFILSRKAGHVSRLRMDSTGLIATQLIALLFMLSLRTGNKCP